jgi:UDP-3-O-[3-hydroxymyristoyl] glucosamine N-acyltransferase
MTPKDNELRMQVGLVITHTNDELLFVRSEKYANTLDALQAFADLIRQDEREACAKLCKVMLWRTPYEIVVEAKIRGRGKE